MGEDWLSWYLKGMPDTQKQQTVSSKIRTPMTQSIAPKQTITPQSYKGVTDYNPPTVKAAGSEAGTPWGLIASVAATNAWRLYEGLNPAVRADDLLQEAGRSNQSTRGIGYESQNYVDKDRVMDDYDRSNTSKLFSGNVLGFVAGNLWGRDKVKEQIEAANRKALATNNVNRNIAATDALRMNFAQRYGDQSGQILHAAKGKDFNTMTNSYMPGIVHTVHGLMPGIQNVKANKGETMVSRSTPDAHFITDGPNDTAPAFASDDVAILGAMIDPVTGMSYAKEAEPHTKQIEYIKSLAPKTKDKTTVDTYNKAAQKAIEPHYNALLDYADRQQYYRNIFGYNDPVNMVHAKRGKDALPKMKLGGGFSNALAGGLGLASSIYQYFDARNQRPYRPNTYVRNPYQTRALAELDALRVNPHPVLQQMRAAEARGRNAIARSGGLSAAQKYLANVATTANSQQGIGAALANIQEKNLGYRSAAATAKLNAGAQDAANRMNALRADNEIYMRSHAARQQGMQMGMYNGLAQIQQYLANEYKRRMGNAMIDMYDMDFRNRAKMYKNYSES